MAVLHSYARSAEQNGYYLKGWTPDTGHTTIQSHRICDNLFDWLGYSVGDQVPHDLLTGLLEVGLLYTGNPTRAEDIPEDFDFGRDVKNVLTEKQYNRLVGFVKSYDERPPSKVVNLIDELDAETVAVSDSDIPKYPGAQNLGLENEDEDESLDHGRFEEIIEKVYIEGEGLSGAESNLVEPLPELKDEYNIANAAISYHHTQHPITNASQRDDWLEYKTRAVVETPNGITAGPACGFRVGLSDTSLVVVEIIVNPRDLTDQLSYGEQGVLHRVVLGDGTPEWETTLPAQHGFTEIDDRSSLLRHQLNCLQIFETTIERHPSISKHEMVERIVAEGYLERELKETQSIWQDSSLLGELVTSGSAGDKAMGVVDFFNDTGGYGFIETDAHEEDIFYHMEDIGGQDIEEGQRLRFEFIEAEKGPRATDVERL